MSPMIRLGKVNKESDKIVKKMAKVICGTKLNDHEKEEYLFQCTRAFETQHKAYRIRNADIQRRVKK